MHLVISVLPYKFKLILSQNDVSVVPRILNGLTHVFRVTLILAQYVNRIFTVLKWKKVFQEGIPSNVKMRLAGHTW